MYTVSKYPHGTFCWADNASRDAAAAKPFYMDLFGWGVFDIPAGPDMNYSMFQHQGHFAAGFSAHSQEMMEQGIPSVWSNYVSVDDIDAMIAPVEANGGQVVWGPMDIMESGRMLVIVDPTGAQLGMWQPRMHIGAGIVNTVGAMCWNELLTRDVEGAKAFYSAVFGWEFYGDEHYTHISNRGRSNGGMMQMGESFGEMPPCWMVYFHVADIDAGMERVTALGGEVVRPKMEAPDTGWFTVVKDPAGAAFYLMQLNKADPWEE